MAKLFITILWLTFSLPATAEIQAITNGKSLVISCQQALVAMDKGLEQLEPDAQNNAFNCSHWLNYVLPMQLRGKEISQHSERIASTGIFSTKKRPVLFWILPKKIRMNLENPPIG